MFKCQEGVYAGIDCGTAGVRFLVCRLASDGTIERLYADSVHHNIGHDLNTFGYIREATALHVAQTIKAFTLKAQSIGAKGIRAVGTASFRCASNGQQVLEQISKKALPVDLLTGLQELELSLMGVRPYIPDVRENFYFADSGGGSTEIALVSGQSGDIIAGKSLNFGVSLLAQQLAEVSDKPNEAQLLEFTDDLSQTFRHTMAEWGEFSDMSRTGATKLVMAGAPLYLKRFQLKHDTSRRDEYIGATITLDDILTIAVDLAGLGHEGRKKSDFLDDSGVYFMLPAAIKGAALLQATGLKEIVIASSGICAGLALQQARQQAQQQA